MRRRLQLTAAGGGLRCARRRRRGGGDRRRAQHQRAAERLPGDAGADLDDRQRQVQGRDQPVPGQDRVPAVVPRARGRVTQAHIHFGHEPVRRAASACGSARTTRRSRTLRPARRRARRRRHDHRHDPARGRRRRRPARASRLGEFDELPRRARRRPRRTSTSTRTKSAGRRDPRPARRPTRRTTRPWLRERRTPFPPRAVRETGLSPSGTRRRPAASSASSTVRPAPPSGSVSPPDGLSTSFLPLPPISSAPIRPSSVGPDMSDRIAFGAAHDTHGSRKNVSNDVTLSLIAARIFCWRRTRARSSSLRAAVVLARARERERLRRR